MNQFIRETIYFAVRDYGVSAIVQRLISSEVDVYNGAKEQAVERIPIKVAMLPRAIAREKFGQQLADVGEVEFIFSHNDIDHLTASDAILAEGRLYQIATVDDLSGEGWLVTARDIGAAPDPVEETVSISLNLGGAAGGE